MPFNSIEELNITVSSCSNCQLCKERTQAVPGDGNPNADILFIGEGPGKAEDAQGVPFIGAAGKFLDELLDLIGLERKDVFIANVVKCRPPNNRDPQPKEIAACLPYLKEQIILIQPKIIVTLGRFSMNLFLPDASIGKIHGQLQKQKNLLILPLYHPAVALYNGGMRDVLKKDFQILQAVLEKANNS